MNEDFWEDLLSHIRQRVLVPVVGPDLTVVDSGGAPQTLTSLIGQRLAARYQLNVPSGATTIGEAVAAFLRERGQDEAERLYRVINDIILEIGPSPGNALRNLAAIDDLRLFVSTTPDRLLAQAINDVRYQGRLGARELAFSPTQSTSQQSRNAQPASASDTVVLSLFGQAASTPQYAIHEEDRLEWLHALLSDRASLPEWLDYPLKHQPMLFIGCEMPDWLGRFLLRMSSNTRLSLERSRFFFAGCTTANEPSLSNFFSTYCRKTMVQQSDMEPAAFVAELRARWERSVKTKKAAAVESTNFPAAELVSGLETPTIFVSYMREDIHEARRLCDAITGLGGDVWLDERRIAPGDSWQDEILTRIRRTVRLFVPIISSNTEHEGEGYAFREWTEAVERSRSILGRRFIVPVIVDADYSGDPSSYRRVPDAFRDLHFGHAPGGDPDSALRDVLTDEIRAMRRINAA
ncbi:TIR domain-containing protein [Mycobacterium sp. BK558]|nr:TIR domain-containing protein [Mycobacterium sp. BK558]